MPSHCFSCSYFFFSWTWLCFDPWSFPWKLLNTRQGVNHHLCNILFMVKALSIKSCHLPYSYQPITMVQPHKVCQKLLLPSPTIQKHIGKSMDVHISIIVSGPSQTDAQRVEDAASNCPLITGLRDKGRRGRIWEGGGDTSFTTQSRRIHAAQGLISCMLWSLPCHPLFLRARTEEWHFSLWPNRHSLALDGAEVWQLPPSFMARALPFLFSKHVRWNITHVGYSAIKWTRLHNYSLQYMLRVRVCLRTAENTITAPWIPHTCEVLQRRALHPKAQHLLHRQINGIIPVRCHVHAAAAAAAARVRTPLYRIAVLGFRRRHGGDRGGMGCVRRLSPAQLASTGASASAWRPSPLR